MSPPDFIQKSIFELWPLHLWEQKTIVVGVSGGADSTALLDCLIDILPSSSRLVVAHCNHGLRGEASDADQSFVEEFSRKVGVECIVWKASARETECRSENHLRRIRHTFLREAAKRCDASWIALAHHADDRVETFLHHLIRGSGPSGLSAIHAIRRIDSRTQLVRPLLRVTRSQILDYLSSKKLSFCIDQSNASNLYTRNRIRNELLPALRRFARSDAVDNRFLQASELIAQEHQVIVDLAERWLLELGLDQVSHSGCPEGVAIPIRSILDTPWPVVRHAMTIVWHRLEWPLGAMTHRHWSRLQQMIQAASQTPHPKRLQLPGSVLAQCRKGALRLTGIPPVPLSPQRRV